MLIMANPHAPEHWKHQRDGADFIERLPGALLDCEMGVGKSVIAIEHIRRTKVKKVLIFAPLSVVNYVWEDQFREHTRQTVELVVLGQGYRSLQAKIEHAKLRMALNVQRVPYIVVINYEAALSPTFTEWAERMDWDLIICDESHKVKSDTGSISKWVRKLADKTRRRLLLSGTPMPHSPLDIWAQYRIADKRIFGMSYHMFKSYYAEMERAWGAKSPKAKRVVGFKNPERFRENFKKIAFSIRMRDVLDLPPVRDVPLRVRLSDKTLKAYWDLERNFRAWLESGEQVTVTNALTRLLRLQQMTSGFAVSASTKGIVRLEPRRFDAKYNALVDVLEGIATDEPVVVFARFLADLDSVVEAAEAVGRLGWRYSGGVKQLEEWRKQGGVIAMQIQTGGVGIDLTKASHCIYYSVGLSLGDYLQSRARLDRSGQTRPVTYTHLLGAATVDERIMQLLAEKRDVVQAILESKDIGGD